MESTEAIVYLHDKYFLQLLGWGTRFKEDVSSYLGEFVKHIQPSKDCFWVAKKNDEIVGSIAIDGQSNCPDCARLRWTHLSRQKFDNFKLGFEP